MDESGLQFGETGGEIVARDAQTPGNTAVVAEPTRSKWNTSLEAISAMGKY